MTASAERLAYFDCYSGISGDMVLGALVDAGLELSRLQDLLGALPLSGWRLEAHPVNLYGLRGTRVTVETGSQIGPHHRLQDILTLLDRSVLPETVRKRSAAVFQNLAEAEGAVHGIAPGEVHFHEVGAVDAIIDIVGSVGGLHLLGVEQIFASPLPLSRGMVRCAHGNIPIPAPAVLELLCRRQVPTCGSSVTGELVTPTGAAVLTTLVRSFGPLPPSLVVKQIGYGAGTMDPGYPNFLRLITGQVVEKGTAFEEKACLVETNLDDLSPEIHGYLMELLFKAGADDVFFVPIQMKKNRPAVKLSVMVSPDLLTVLTDLIFRETSTLGIRITGVRKLVRPRCLVSVETPWGTVRVKTVPAAPGTGESVPLHFAPEYADCVAVARRSALPLKEIYRQVEQLFRKQFSANSNRNDKI